MYRWVWIAGWALFLAGCASPDADHVRDYNQDGINTLQQASTTTMSTGIAAGLVLNPIKQTGLSAADLQQAVGALHGVADSMRTCEPI